VSTSRSLRFPSPLIKPDVRISRIRLTDRLHRKAHGATIRLRLAIELPLKSTDAFWCCKAHRQSPTLDLFKSIPEARVLPSTGITRLQQYYDPIRLPPGVPPPTGRSRFPRWASHVTRITFATCRAHYPGGSGGCSCRSLPHPYCLPRSRRVGIRNCTFEACSGFTLVRPAASLDRPRRPLSRGFDTSSYPPATLVSFRSHRRFFGWNPPPRVMRALVAHLEAGGPYEPD
jgi:hypothetical protein